MTIYTVYFTPSKSRCCTDTNSEPQPTSKNYSPDNPFNNEQDRHYSPRNLISDRTLIILFSYNTLFFLQHDHFSVGRFAFACLVGNYDTIFQRQIQLIAAILLNIPEINNLYHFLQSL